MDKYGVQRLFDAMQMVRNTRAMLQVMSAFQGTFQEHMIMSGKIHKCPENNK